MAAREQQQQQQQQQQLLLLQQQQQQQQQQPLRRKFAIYQWIIATALLVHLGFVYVIQKQTMAQASISASSTALLHTDSTTTSRARNSQDPAPATAEEDTFARKDARANLLSTEARRGVTVVLTSAGRTDLLRKTLKSFQEYNTYPITRGILIEDSGQVGIVDFAHDLVNFPLDIIYNPDLGQQRRHKVGMLGLLASVDKAYGQVTTEFIFHMEDDWQFHRSGFIERSIDILDTDPALLQVWLRAHNDGHAVGTGPFRTLQNQKYYWMDPDYHSWHGFSFNPGLRRLRDYQFIGSSYVAATTPIATNGIPWEYDISVLYYKLGFKAAITDVADGFVFHLGWGRSTDPACFNGCSRNDSSTPATTLTSTTTESSG